MTRSEEYLFKAAELFDVADREKDAALKVGFRQLAASYLRLAQQAERNVRLSMANLRRQAGARGST